MAKDTQSLRVNITGDASKLNKELQGVTGRMEQFGSKLSGTGKAMTKWVTGPLALAGGAATKMASDLEQSAGAVESVFGDASDQIENFGDTAADSLGLSRREVNETAAQLGAQLKSMGRDSDEAAQEVIKLEKRAADMAATFGGTTREALEAIGSLMRGERDPIEKYGVSLKQADINARIMADGLDTSTTAAQKQAEATAAMNILLEQTSDVQGQFARESDTAAGSQQRLQAQLENTAAEIGENLLPAKVAVTEAAAGLTGAFDDLSPAAQNTVVALGGVAAATGPVLWGIGSIAQGTGKMVTGFKRSAEAARALNTRLGGLRGTMRAGIGVAFVLQDLNAAKQAMDEFGDTIETVDGKIQHTAESQQEWQGIWPELRENIADIFQPLEAGAQLMEIFDEKLSGANREFESTGEILPSVTGYVEDLNDPLSHLPPALRDTAEAAGMAGDEADDLSRTAGELVDQLDQLNGSTISVERAAIAWGNQIGSLDEKLAETSGTLEVNTEEGRSNRAMLLDTAEAARNHVQAMIEDGASTEQATRALQTHVGELRQQAIEGGVAEAQIDSYISTLKLTPDHIRTLVEAETAQAEAKVRNLNDWLDRLSGTRRVAVELATGGFGTPTFPTGHAGGRVENLPGTAGLPSGDERLVKARTGERLLDRGQTRAFEQLHGGEMVAVLRRIEGKLDRPRGGDGAQIVINNPQGRPAEQDLARVNRRRSYLAGE